LAQINTLEGWCDTAKDYYHFLNQARDEYAKGESQIARDLLDTARVDGRKFNENLAVLH